MEKKIDDINLQTNRQKQETERGYFVCLLNYVVHIGVMGKSNYNNGGGVTYLCMPLDPEFPHNAQGGYQTGAYVYGVEYDLGYPELRPQDAPCAVCEVQGRSTVLMIPAKQTCPAGWTLEYEGLLATQRHTHAGAEYVCISSNPETANSGHTDENGGHLLVAEAVCGSLPCPPYVNGYELTCVVCTK